MRILLLTLLAFLSFSCFAKTWVVEPGGTYSTPFSVASIVADGDTIQIKAATYSNQRQTYFRKNNLFIQGVDGTPKIEGGATLAANGNGKALFVISGADCHVDNIWFADASVPDLNGAGIRQEGCDLTVTNCRFTGNEMGILGGNYSDCKVTIEHCIFMNNGNPKRPGFQHNVYINHVDTLVFQYNLTYDAVAEGQELKSRARSNIIRYNYIANISTGDSRNIDLPNGGTSIILGNIIEQSPQSVNSNLVGYGLEGLTNPGPHDLWVINNTFINRKNRGNFVQVQSGMDSLTLKNNIMIGAKTSGLILGSPLALDSASNLVSDNVNAAKFDAMATSKYMIEKGSPCVNKGVFVKERPLGYSMRPSFQYLDTANISSRFFDQTIDIGAYEFKGSVGVWDKGEGLKDKGLFVYPNPVTDGWVRVLEHSSSEFQLYSVLGELVDEGLVKNELIEIDVPEGVYILVVGNGVVRLQVVD